MGGSMDSRLLQVSRRHASHLLIPAMLVSILTALGVLVLYLQARTHESERVQLQCRVTADQVQRRLEAWVTARTSLLKDFAEDWTRLDGNAPHAFCHEAERLLQHYPDFQAINFVDPDGIIRMVMPEASNLPALNQNLYDHEDPSVPNALRNALETGDISRPLTVDLFQGGKGWVTYLPLYDAQGGHIGFVNGVFRVEDLVNACLPEAHLRKRYGFTLKENDGRVAFINDLDPQMLRQFDAVKTSISVINRDMTLSLWPSSFLVAEEKTRVNEPFLLIGLLLASALGVLVYVLLLRHRDLEDRESQISTILQNAPSAMLLVNSDFLVTKSNWPESPTGAAANMPARLGSLLHYAGQRMSLGRIEGALRGIDSPMRELVRDTLENGTSHYRKEAFVQEPEDDKAQDLSVLVTTHPLRGIDESLALVYIEDVSDLRRTERALRRSEDRYRTIFEESPLPLSEEDFSEVKQYLDRLRNKGVTNLRGYFASHPEDALHCASLVHIRDVNKAALALYGIAAKKGLRHGLVPALTHENTALLVEEFAAIDAGATRFENETVDLAISGHERNVVLRWSVAPGFEKTYGKVLVSVMDITERQRAQSTIEAIFKGTAPETGQDFFRALVKHLAQALGVKHAFVGEFDGATRISVLAMWAIDDYVEDMEYDMGGTPCEEVIRQGLCCHPSGVRDLFPSDQPLAKLKIESYLGAPLRNSAGNTIGVLVVMDTIPMRETEWASRVLEVFASRAGAELARNRAERERDRFEMQLRHSQKLESLGILAGGIAHDFNNILAAILGNASLALEDLPASSPLRPNLSDIECAAKRAADLCNQMLAYSGKGRFHITPTILNDVVREMGHLLDVCISKSATLKYELDAHIPHIEADATQIRQVVMNLITNASEAIGAKQGIIVVRTGARDCKPGELMVGDMYVAEDAPVPGRYVFLEVEDTGCGMDNEVRQRLFDPFFTTKFTGRGLGMAAVIGIVRGHRGYIDVTSRVNNGTKITVLFPAAMDTATPSGKVSTETSVRVQDADHTVLVVDDEPAVRAVAARVLDRAGYRTLDAVNGPEALALLASDEHQISAVILDLTMPGMPSAAVLLELRNRYPRLPVILSSGYSKEEAATQVTDHAPDAFIQKPYQPAQLLEILAQVMDSRRGSA